MTVITFLEMEGLQNAAGSQDAHQPVSEDAASSASAGDPTPAQPLSPEQKERTRQRMLERLSVSSAHFAHRQRDMPDLTAGENFDIAADILQKEPVQFLARFGKYLQSSDLAYFQGADNSSYEIQFYLKEIHHRCSHSEVIVKNRRFAAMKELEEGGVYFSEDEMRCREPLLYQQMVGQYLTEAELERQAEDAIDRGDLRLSTILMKHMDDTQQQALYTVQKETEECQEEEEEESDEDEEKNPHHGGKEDNSDEETEDVPEISDVRANDILRQQLQDEFRAIMHEKFLSGSDEQFDYSKVDDNPNYDNLTTVAQDEENRYFLSEEPFIFDEDNGDSNSVKDNTESVQPGMDVDEEEDYMNYEPPSQLVAKSAQFVKTGTWDDQSNT